MGQTERPQQAYAAYLRQNQSQEKEMKNELDHRKSPWDK